MTEIKDLSITSATFTVKVLRVDNHKMTKATFRQIRVKNIQSWPDSESILGYVMDEKTPWLLYMHDELLWKCSVWDWRHKITPPVGEPEWGSRCFEDYDQLFIAT